MDSNEIKLIKDLYSHYKSDENLDEEILNSLTEEYGSIRGILMNVILKYDSEAEISDEYLDAKLKQYNIDLKSTIQENDANESKEDDVVSSEIIGDTQEKQPPVASSSKKTKRRWVLPVSLVSIIIILGAIFFFLTSNNSEVNIIRITDTLPAMEDNNVCSTVLRKIMDYDERYYFEGINDKASNQLINLDDYDVILNIPEELRELDEFKSTLEKNMDGINKIHPIGWSKNGMFAYIETGNSDMVGGFNRLKVTDMVSDKNIISFTGGDEMVSLSTKEWWCLNYIEISSLLYQYEIFEMGMVLEMNNEDVVIKYLSYKDISDADNNSIYSITTKYSNCRKSNNIAVCDGQTCDVQVIVVNNNTGKEKSIFKKNSFCGSKLTFVSAIKNPLEDRITILVKYEKRGFEGVYTRDIMNIGCKLF
tara:strand:- start:701 stop:1963 length:1263 start_codon:yes stop_codon:yes gene_type:complete